MNALINGDVSDPWDVTVWKLANWTDGEIYGKVPGGGAVGAVKDSGEAKADDVVEFFRMEDNDSMERFLSTILEAVSNPDERKQIAVRVLAEVKLQRIRSGRSITKDLLDLEARLLVGD